MSDTNDPVNLTTDGINASDPVVVRAHRRWRKCWDWESNARNNWLLDYKFANGDVYNNYQWPINLYEARGERPSLTVNETRQKNLHIINEAKQNKAGVKYRATGGGATEAAAEVYEGLYRHIANQSNSQMAQGQAISFQVQAGLGFTIIEADYIDPAPNPTADAFNQEIFIRGVDDPLSVMLDCDATEPDFSDARYGFVFKDRPLDEIEEEYPELKGRLTAANAVDGDAAPWVREGHARECKYYEVEEDKDELLGDDEGTTTYASKVPDELIKQWEEEHEARGSKLRRRPVIRKRVKAHLIIGSEKVRTDDVPGTQVPIIAWVGEQTVIDQIMDRKGHTRALISPQQMLNYNWSASIEFGALQSKSPYLTPAAAIEGYETYWATANTENHAFLPWNHRDDEGNDIPPPQRQEPPTAAPVFVQGAMMAREFMQTASGQYEAMMGDQGNERSGKAINERQRMGERATYHFIDNQALAIRRQGVIIKEWIPVIYDTARVARIMDEDGSEKDIHIDPAAPVAHHEQMIGDAIKRIFNPRVGTYEVVSDTGPDYATQRQEAFNAIVQILTQAPALIDQIGDLLFKVAERLKPGLPPAAQAAITELQKQLANQNRLLAEAMQAVTEERLKAKAKDQEVEIRAFEADTNRAKMLLDGATKVDPAAAMAMIHEMAQEAVRQAMQDNLGAVRLSAAPDLGLEAQGQPLPGATGAVPAPTPDVGQQAATPGGQ